MALKDWLDTGKCLLGLHQGDWRLEAPGRCVLVQTCERCGAVNQREEHSWLDWHYAAEHRCDLSRSCSRCAESENRFEHQWGAWIYREDDSCEQRYSLRALQRMERRNSNRTPLGTVGIQRALSRPATRLQPLRATRVLLHRSKTGPGRGFFRGRGEGTRADIK